MSGAFAPDLDSFWSDIAQSRYEKVLIGLNKFIPIDKDLLKWLQRLKYKSSSGRLVSFEYHLGQFFKTHLSNQFTEPEKKRCTNKRAAYIMNMNARYQYLFLA